MIKVGIVCIIDKSIAENLKAKGFQYIPEVAANEYGEKCTFYQFIQNSALIEELASNYDERDFFIKGSLSF